MATSGGSRKLPGSSDNDGTWSLVTPDLPVDGLSDLALTVMLEPDRSRIRLDAQTAAVIGVTGSIPDDIGNGILTILPTIPSGPDQASGPAALADHVRTIVFIDSAVSDAELLALGVVPGAIAVVLPGGQDGVVAIANWLTEHGAQDLASIAIVAHGADGLLLLGSAALETATLPRYQVELARIGLALAPDGDILLYGCDVAQDVSGAAFVGQLSAATGGANIAAASHMIGASDQGGSFELDINYGFVDSGSPFTALAQADFSDILPTAINQLYYTTTGADTNTLAALRVAQIGVSGTIQTGGSVTLRNATQEAVWNSIPAVTADPASGKYFVLDTAAGKAPRILSGSINSPGAFTQILSYAASTMRPIDITIDQPAQTLYFTLSPTTVSSVAADIGVWKIKEDGTGLTQVVGGYTSVSATTTPKALALDLPNNLVFFSEGGAVSGTSRLLVGNTVSGTKSAALISHNIGTLISDVLVHNGTLYYSTVNGGTVSSNNIFAVPYTVSGSGGSATAVLGTVSTLYAGANAGNPISIAIDPVTGRLYTAGSTPVPSTPTPGFATMAINVGTIAGGGAMQQLFTQSNGTIGVNGSGLFFESTPTVTASGTVTHVTGGAAITIAPSAGVVSPSGFTLKSATVEITGGNFTNDGDTLTAVTSGTSITASFSGDKLSLSGIDTAAHYKQVLNSVAYKSTASDPSNGAANLTRTVTWTVSDGVIESSSPTTTINIHGLPTVVAGGTVSFSGGGSPVTLNSGLTVNDLFSTTLSSATVSIGSFFSGDVLNFINQGGIVGSYTTSNGTLSLSGVASLATYQTALRSVTYSYSPGNGDPTGGGTRTARTFNWTVNDSIAASAAVTSNMNVIHVAPTITAAGTITYGIGHGPAALDPTLTVVSPNSGGLLSSAKVTVTGGSFVGEADVLTATTAGTSITFNYNQTTDIATLSGADTVANYQSVLRSVTISSAADPSNNGTNKTRTFSWTVNDGVVSSAASNSFADAVLCFTEGTRIMTPNGEVAVEALKEGDAVLTHTGAERPIRWIGHRHLDMTRHPEPWRVQPVRILADAIAPGVPARDVDLSPDHAVLLDGALVPAHLLRNGATIRQDTDRVRVTYYHVELDTHDVLLAESLPAESYLDTGNRGFFANGGAPLQLHPDLLDTTDGQAVRDQASCAPFVVEPARTQPLWQRLVDRAMELGHTLPAPADRTGEPDLHIIVGDRRLRPVSREANRYVFILPPSDAAVDLVSRTMVPSQVRPWIDDRRSLGVMVSRLTLRMRDGTVVAIPLDHPDLVEGWWDTEWHNPTALRRWTNGRARLPAQTLGAAVLEVVIGATQDYACEMADGSRRNRIAAAGRELARVA